MGNNQVTSSISFYLLQLTWLFGDYRETSSLDFHIKQLSKVTTNLLVPQRSIYQLSWLLGDYRKNNSFAFHKLSLQLIAKRLHLEFRSPEKCFHFFPVEILHCFGNVHFLCLKVLLDLRPKSILNLKFSPLTQNYSKS